MGAWGWAPGTALALADWSLAWAAGYSWSNTDLELSFTALRSEADGARSRFLGGELRQRLTPAVALGARADLELGGGPLLAELRLELAL